MKVHYISGVAYDSNVYLLEGEDPIVVDAGTGVYVSGVLEEISRMVPLETIGRIVLTHSHYDHIGGAAAMQAATGAKVLLHEAEAMPLLEGDTSLTASSMFGRGVGEIEVEPLRSGQKLSCGSRELEIVHTPGHSPGSIALVDAEDRSAIVGDTVFCDGGVGRWDLPGGDLGQLIESLGRLKNLDLKNMYPGHGGYAEGDAAQHLRLAAKYLEGAY
jgi:hydroxyacylglutathione hydrolase